MSNFVLFVCLLERERFLHGGQGNAITNLVLGDRVRVVLGILLLRGGVPIWGVCGGLLGAEGRVEEGVEGEAGDDADRSEEGDLPALAGLGELQIRPGARNVLGSTGLSIETEAVTEPDLGKRVALEVLVVTSLSDHAAPGAATNPGGGVEVEVVLEGGDDLALGVQDGVVPLAELRLPLQ